jgi:uncharacterized coiled-coil protein SlyX
MPSSHDIGSSNEARLTELEIRASHLDATLDDVGAILMRQQNTIDELTRAIEILTKRLGLALADADPGSDPDQSSF